MSNSRATKKLTAIKPLLQASKPLRQTLHENIPRQFPLTTRTPYESALRRGEIDAL